MTQERKQEYLALVEKHKSALSMSLGETGQSMNLIFWKNDNSTLAYPSNYSCKESFIYVLGTNMYPKASKECCGIIGTPNTIDRIIRFWKRKDLPDFDKEIIKITDEVYVLLIFLDSEIFKTNLLYLDVLCTMTRLFSKEKDKVKNIVNLIPNENSYLNLQDGVKLVLKTPREIISNLNIKFISMPTEIGGGTGIGRAFKQGVLQKALAEHQKQ